MCINVFEVVFKKYGEIYKNILSNIYPSLKSTGFPERNLSVNFSKAYEKIAFQNSEEVYSWFEFQFSGEKGNNRHIDAVIVNNTSNELLIIESKRYSDPNNKLIEIGEDIDRIYEFVKQLEKENKEKNERIEFSKYNKIYGVILADIWEENNIKNTILNAYKNKNLLNNNQFSINHNHIINNEKYDVQKIKVKYINPDKYNLVSLYWEIK